MKKLSLVLIILLAWSGIAFAEINITVNTIMRLDASPYDVSDTVIIHPGAILYIEAGVEVRNANIYVQSGGTLHSMGTSSQPVVFVNCATTVAGVFIPGTSIFKTEEPEANVNIVPILQLLLLDE